MGAPAEPQIIGRYAIYGKIASGGMASVYFGRLMGPAGFSRTVAIKRLHPHLVEEAEFLATMVDEARIAARIHHPNVVPTLDVVATEGELLLVMEYVRGESLARLVRNMADRDQRIPLPIAIAIATGALHGLHAAHHATSDQGKPLGIVHRDVSPQNILVGADGVTRVIDFGVAKAAGRLQTTSEGVVKGKVAYMAPEQLEGIAVTPRADVYAMAVVLWEMLAGRRLFQTDVGAVLLHLVLGGCNEPPSAYAPDLPAALDALVMKGLSVDPSLRFESAQEMAEALARIAPPSLPIEVGRWVGDVAQSSLSERSALLANIESDSGIQSLSPRAGVGRSAESPAASRSEELPTIASQPSSLSLETPKPMAGPGGRSRHWRRPGAIGALAALIIGGAAVILLRGAAPTSPRTEPTGAAVASGVAPAAPASSQPELQGSAMASSSPSSIGSVAPLAAAASSAGRPGPPPAAPARPRSPRPAAPAAPTVDPASFR